MHGLISLNQFSETATSHYVACLDEQVILRPVPDRKGCIPAPSSESSCCVCWAVLALHNTNMGLSRQYTIQHNIVGVTASLLESLLHLAFKHQHA